MNKKTISTILLFLFFIGLGLTIANTFLNESENSYKSGQISINNSTITYDASGECLEVKDGNTIWVYGIGDVQLTQIKTPQKGESGFNEAKKFVEDKCLGKTVYLDIDNVTPKDKYERTLAIVYTEKESINDEIIKNKLGEINYFPPSEFKKGDLI